MNKDRLDCFITRVKNTWYTCKYHAYYLTFILPINDVTYINMIQLKAYFHGKRFGQCGKERFKDNFAVHFEQRYFLCTTHRM